MNRAGTRTKRIDRHELASLASLAWPVVVAQMGFMLLGVVDTIMVARFDERALGGVALGNTWSFAWAVLLRGCAMGLDPVIAQAHGAGDQRAFARALAQGLVLITVLAIPFTMLHGFAEEGFTLLGLPSDGLALAEAYALAVAPSVWAMAAEGLFRQALQARGRMRPPMWVAFLGNLVNVPANLFFIYGVGSFEGFGAVGAGYATAVVRWFMFLAMVIFAWDDVRAVLRELPGVRPAAVVSLAGLAVPVGLQTGLEVWGFSFGTVFAGWFGPNAVGAHAVALNLAAFSFMVPLGVGAAAATRVGNLLGAGRPWQESGRTAILMGLAWMSVSATIFGLFPEKLASIYVDEGGELLALVVTLLPIAACFQLFDAFQAIAFGVLRGAGDTVVPSLANIVGYYVIGLPLAAWLAWECGYGVAGVWMGLTVALVVVASILFVRLRQVEAVGGFRRVGAA